ncbi:MAG: CvpA family protein [Chloroflexi bacterium]|nr:CvpA family protein [Chloroflexota bacterium]MDA1271252.1 CvpA family protein [Chloroflexota bacterium]
MNWVDIAILAVWGLTAFWGYSTGLIRMVVPLVALAAGLALSSRVGDSAGNLFSGLTDDPNIQTIAGFVLIFGGMFIIGAIVSHLIRATLGIIPLFGLVNSLAGTAAGLLVGFLLLSGLLTGVQRFPFGEMDQTIDESALGAFLADNFDVVIRGIKLIPGDWDNELGRLNPNN